MTGFFSGTTDLDSIFLSDYSVIDNASGTGTLWVWGSNNSGALGTNDVTNRSSPVQTVAGGTNWKQVSGGYYHTAAIKTDGTLWAWGYNADGTIGDNTTIIKSSPVQTISAGTNWKQVSSGGFHEGAIKTDGTLWMWGYGSLGQLGTNDRTSRSSPIQTVSAGTNWKQVSCGGYHTGAIKTDGTLWLWGYNNFGQLGNNDIADRSSPIQTVSGGTNWKQVICGIMFTGAIKTDGTLWMWGLNTYGQLGTNDRTDRSSPTQTVAGGTNWKQLFPGTAQYHAGAIKTDGTLWMWGNNNSGQLGVNDQNHRSSPTQTVAGGTNWKQVSCGQYETAAIKTDGTLWVWGYNAYGELGTNNQTYYSSPIQTVATGGNWKQVDCGESHFCAVYFNDADSGYPSSGT